MKVVKYTILLLVSLGVSLASFAQDADSVSSHNDIKLILPDSSGWNIIKENEELSFQVHTTDPDPAFYAIQGGEDLDITLDSLGNFFWKPSYDLVDRVTRMKDYTVVIEASWPACCATRDGCSRAA